MKERRTTHYKQTKFHNNLSGLQMVHMPNLESWEWGLKIFHVHESHVHVHVHVHVQCPGVHDCGGLRNADRHVIDSLPLRDTSMANCQNSNSIMMREYVLTMHHRHVTFAACHYQY